MIDLTNYDVEVKKALTQAEYDERVEKGLIKHGDIVDVYDNWGNIKKVKLCIISPPGWIDTIKKLKKNNWQDKHELGLIYKYQEELWACIKERNVIPKDIANEIEKEIKKECQ